MKKYLPIHFTLLSSQLVSSNGEPLRQYELMKLWEFMNMMIGSRYSTFILRGESNENLRTQYNYDTHTPELLAQCIFMTGEKGRICWNNNRFLDPDDVSSENFELICLTLLNYINEGCKQTGNRSKKINDFLSRNPMFYSALNNTKTIVHTYQKLSNENKKIINLYYLAIAHTINSHKYRRASSFISTTTSQQVANDFATDTIIYGWIPQNMINKKEATIDYVIIKNKFTIKQLGMPYCESPIYLGQEEISLRCGILPHFIIGFKVDKTFYVNPAIFQTIDEMNKLNSYSQLCTYKKKIILHGLSIDQTDFEAFCHRTNYKRFYTFDGSTYELHPLFYNTLNY